MLRVHEYGPLTRIVLARTALGRPLYTVAAYAIGELLIDSGCPATARALARFCRDRGVRLVVHTHHHEDHTGGSAHLARALGIRVIAPESTARILASFERVPLYRRLVWGRPSPVRAETMPPVLEAGGLRLLAIHTPGHCDDHHCLFDRERGWLFSGDLFVHERVRYARASENVQAQLHALRAMRALEPSLLVCAHAGVVRDAKGALSRRIAFWEELADRIATMRAGGASWKTITRTLLGAEGWLTYASLGDFSKINLVRALGTLA